MSNVRATFYAHVEPEWGAGNDPTTGERRVRGAVVRRVTQRRPENHPGAVVVKLTVELPERAFLPLTPEAIISIPEEAVAVPVVVVVDDPA